MAKIVMAGYLGCGNLGDDAVMLGVMDRLGDHDYTIMSGSPSESNQNFGIRAIDRRDARMTDSVIKESDAVVFPGGSIFQDVTSAKSTVYYNGIVKIAKKHGKKDATAGAPRMALPSTTSVRHRATTSPTQSASIFTLVRLSSCDHAWDLYALRCVRACVRGIH